MRGSIQDLLRWWIGASLQLLGHLLQLVHRRRIRRFDRTQVELRRTYGIDDRAPVLEFGEEIRASIARYIAASKSEVSLASTSGSTGVPKQLAYPAARVRRVKWTFIDAFSRAYACIRVRRKSLYVFSALDGDASLTGMLLAERGLPPYLASLQAPYRVQQHPELLALAERYGGPALRLFVLTVANPGVLYATNPSTLSQFLEDVSDRFAETSGLIRDYASAPERFSPTVRAIVRRLESRGTQRRLEHAASASACSIFDCAPAIEAYICWTGGYVRPFLERIERHLPRERVRRIPMYSMSTETIETIPHYLADRSDRDGIAFLPLADGVLYEFIADGDDDLPERLLGPRQLEPGKSYAMVVSDRYGLRRYQTGDIFRVERVVAGLPDLAFVRRRGLTYSFTGEKLTAEQVSLAVDALRSEVGPGVGGWFFSVVPSVSDGALPHYKLLVVVGGGGGGGGGEDLGRIDSIAERFDGLLASINHEYRHKRETARLGPLQAVPMRLEELAQRVGSATPRSDWESQLKFLPLYPRLFD